MLLAEPGRYRGRVVSLVDSQLEAQEASRGRFHLNWDYLTKNSNTDDKSGESELNEETGSLIMSFRSNANTWSIRGEYDKEAA